MSLKEKFNVKIVYFFLIASLFIGALFLFSFTPSQTSKWVYITKCYFNPIRYLKKEHGFLNYEKKYNGVWNDWNKDGSLAYTTELTDGFQNGKKIHFPYNIIVSNGVVKNNKFTGVENYNEAYSKNKKYFENGLLICWVHNFIAPNYFEVDYFENEIKSKKLIYREGEFKLEVYKNGKLVETVLDLIDLAILKLNNSKLDQFENMTYNIENKTTDLGLKFTVTFEEEKDIKDLTDYYTKENMYVLECDFEKGLISIFHFKNKLQINKKDYSLDDMANSTQ